MKQSQRVDSKTFLAFTILWVVFPALFALWSYNQSPQWEKLAPPPAPVAELLPPWDYVRIQTIDNIIYSKDVWGRRVEESWFIDNDSTVSHVGSYSPACTFAEIPTAIRGSSPQSVQTCYKFYIHVEALPSYVVLDKAQQLWVWTYQELAITTILFGGSLLILAFTLFPFLFIAAKFVHRRHLEIPVAPDRQNDGHLAGE